jgi:predicted PurR-regulated permease PerM
MLGLTVLVYFARNAITVLFLAVFISSALDSLVIRLEHFRVPRLLGTILVFLTLLLSVAILIYTIVPIALFELRGIFNNLNGVVGQILNLGIPQQFTNFIDSNLENISNTLFAGNTSFLETMSRLIGGVALLLATFVIAFYLTLSRDGVGRFIRAIFPENLEDKVLSIYYRSKKKIGNWFQAQLILSCVVGFLVFTGLWILGVKYAVILGIFAAMFELVPIVGPIFAGGLAVVIGFSQSVTTGVYVLLLFLVVQQTENHVLVPLMMKKAIDVHPVVILVALLSGAELAGFVGLLLAVPAVVVASEIVEDWVTQKEINRRNSET